MKFKRVFSYLVCILFLVSCSNFNQKEAVQNKVIVEYYDYSISNERKKIELDFSNEEDKAFLQKFKKEILDFTKDYKEKEVYKAEVNVFIKLQNDINLEISDFNDLYSNKMIILNRKQDKYGGSYKVSPDEPIYADLQRLLQKLNKKGN